ncbi:hypothetical protein LINPERPRIM_LOCUS25556 [Linum perenne]
MDPSLDIAWNAGHRRVAIQLDSLFAISLLSTKNDLMHQHGMETAQFQELYSRDCTVQLKHTYKEGNHAVDYLASIGYDYPFGSHTILLSNCNLEFFLRMSISKPRRISINN